MARGISFLVQGNFRATGPFTKQSRSLPTFDRVEAGQIFDVDISIGSHPSLVFEAPRDLIPHLTSRVQAGTLVLSANIPYSLSTSQKVKAHIVAPHLKGVSISGAGRMVVKGLINASNFDASVSGAASLSLSAKVRTIKVEVDGAAKAWINKLTANSLDIQTSGAANCTLNGRVDTSNIETDGASGVRARELTTTRARIQSSGSSYADIRVVSELNAEASGASSIRYYGNPKTRNDTSGSAHIVQGG